MTQALVRLVVWLLVTLVAATVRLLLLVVRLGLWLFALAGFRGARLLGLAATVAGVRWAAATVGAGPAVRLAAIGWAAWALRHHRAAIRRNAAGRRASRRRWRSSPQGSRRWPATWPRAGASGPARPRPPRTPPSWTGRSPD